MVAEPWLLKMGNQVSSNLKHALYLENSSQSSSTKKQGLLQEKKQQTLGILAFEVANVMSKVVHLHKSLTDTEILKLKNEILNSKGIKALAYSDDEQQLLELALIEKLDDLNRVAYVVSRLGKKSTIPALQGFEHVYADIVSGAIDIKDLSFLVKDMEGMVRKMERYVNSTAALHAEMEVANELESATKKFRQNQMEETRKAFEQKLMWQRQDVKHLQEISLWNQTYDKAAEILARTACTIYARICSVFGDEALISQFHGNSHGRKSRPVSGVSKVLKDPCLRKSISAKNGDKEGFGPKLGSQRSKEGSFRPQDFKFACGGNNPGRLFVECLNLSSSASKVDDDDDEDDRSSQVSGFSTVSNGNFLRAITRDETEPKGIFVNTSTFGPRSHLLSHGPPTTLGGSALALHYANIIIVLEKLLQYPHLVGDEAREDLYQMLTGTIREKLKRKLRPHAKEVAIYDAHLAHDWRERAGSAVVWLGPMARNTMTWQTERSFEHRGMVPRTNVLLLQTLYFADRGKTEDVMCEVIFGLNYVCRYEQQRNALLDCGSSFDFEEEWRVRARDSFRV